MVMFRYAGLVFVLLICGCNGRHGAGHKMHLSLIAPPNPIKKKDTTQDAFYKNRYYLPTIIRLSRNDKEAFIRIDSPYFNFQRLDTNNREAYYEKVIAAIPEEDKEVYRIIWTVPEMRKMQTADGGYGTLVATIASRPDKEHAYYVAEIKRNNIDEMPLDNDIAYFRIKLHPLQVELSDQSAYFVSLEEWEHVNKTR
jgi:hypothetical protein